MINGTEVWHRTLPDWGRGRGGYRVPRPRPRHVDYVGLQTSTPSVYLSVQYYLHYLHYLRRQDEQNCFPRAPGRVLVQGFANWSGIVPCGLFSVGTCPGFSLCRVFKTDKCIDGENSRVLPSREGARASLLTRSLRHAWFRPLDCRQRVAPSQHRRRWAVPVVPIRRPRRRPRRMPRTTWRMSTRWAGALQRWGRCSRRNQRPQSGCGVRRI